ncbi:E3 ubiquitin-protein ligase ZNRF1 isoform X2 [Frankliniella occidentalis]|uniref:E3 ubiquitin-protein ligase ZNRF1 n=1 Tax=Frankliniella occidentalis TaxID=133901 RepID=A0A6J1RZS7_FRAOC|nr:E3 ubiquitin-protein ligase ZNRF1 isoform X2 [Frankliniella occidentalis]
MGVVLGSCVPDEPEPLAPLGALGRPRAASEASAWRPRHAPRRARRLCSVDRDNYYEEDDGVEEGVEEEEDEEEDEDLEGGDVDEEDVNGCDADLDEEVDDDVTASLASPLSRASRARRNLMYGIKCPVCSKFVLSDDIECHIVMCLTKPRLSYNEDVLTDDKGECVICLEDLLQGDTIARLPCLCIYHKNCIDRWFEVNRSCPEHPGD